MKEYKIIEIQDKDLNRCVEVIREGFGTVARDFGFTEQNNPTHGSFMTIEQLLRHKEKGKLMFSLQVNHEIIGYLQLDFHGDGLYVLEKLTVLPSYRNLGYGSAMLKFAKRAVKERKGSKIRIGIVEEHTSVKVWYQRHGFSHIGTKRFDHLPFTVGWMEMDI